MRGGGESVFGVLLDVAIGLGCGGCAIAEGPNLLAIRGAEGPDLKVTACPGAMPVVGQCAA